MMIENGHIHLFSDHDLVTLFCKFEKKANFIKLLGNIPFLIKLLSNNYDVSIVIKDDIVRLKLPIYCRIAGCNDGVKSKVLNRA